MKDNKYKIYNIIKQYEIHFKNNFKILTKNSSINFNFDFGGFCHLLGLQYCGRPTTAKEEGYKILKNKLDDKTIYENALKTGGKMNFKILNDRVNNIEFFLKI
ncbi:hypothetical protein [Streptobacillus moniliformis]|uniref:Cyclic nucleotide-binding domain containing protein n=1 Tax=Streptobacillus moniliformis (strain ATCC 14647 / DSM 12112 / NCTC 10651 / 9901) TaxID=519441 RepID=D1AYG0_STRM9|nr:hypothetical protein [Streptobacillus moniliformis]ACZ01336.1 cyclic nucleotide-binding domain containing protein [Streptobacillus moniliformis DSM 12112]AVL43645.1 hypothetical protein CEP89_07500 [Streptobacillus moniliformis]SQA13505.1 Uncharacterised protein [Streptobacillus moniliformis]